MTPEMEISLDELENPVYLGRDEPNKHIFSPGSLPFGSSTIELCGVLIP